MSYYLRSLSGISVLVLTVTNIFLTVRLLHTTTNCSSSNNVGFISSSSSISNSNGIVGQLLPEITSKLCSDYEIQQQQQQQQQQQLPQLQESNNIQQEFDEIVAAVGGNSGNNDFNDASLVKFLQIDFTLGRWDNQRLYKLYDFIIVGNKFSDLSKSYLICLATQSSIERLHFLVQVAEHWNGPISIAIYVAGDDEFHIFKLFLLYLRQCYPVVHDNLSFHLAVPKDRIPKYYTTSKNSISDALSSFYLNTPKFRAFLENNVNFYRTCTSSPEIILRRLLKLRTAEHLKWRQKQPYPQNHMRNLARKGCQTKYVFLTDVDIIPSVNFTENVDKFLKTHPCNITNNIGGLKSIGRGIRRNTVLSGGIDNGDTEFCAYVVPTYEIDFRVRFPANKSDLIRLVNKGLARPFHEKVFVYNQFATNFSRWQSDRTSNIDTHISHNVTNFEFLYEPFYISTDNVPIHDERFLGYGFTRNSQVYEMYIAGYVFQVLSPVFTCHWGLQQKKTRPAWREQQNNLNRRHFERFKREILARYNKQEPLQQQLQQKQQQQRQQQQHQQLQRSSLLHI